MFTPYLDNDVALALARLTRADGLSAVVAAEVGLTGAGDDEQLLLAAERGWTLVTHNRRDFILLHNAWRRWRFIGHSPRPHAGILILPQPPICSVVLAARVLVDLANEAVSLTDELYEWHPSHGWLHRAYPVGRGRSP